MGWAEIIGRLIRAGHRWRDIQFYTKAQLNLFFRAIAKVEREERAARLYDAALSAGAAVSKDGLKALNRKIRELQG
ncbi:MAG: hypothetical protein MH252_08505 [Thermosynechococcaceae cyanobacterium MS004]|nr:hypothetical protein [Thermosynechococcaceae cyanobacterium MS004]